jgi:hypothetical protein
VKTLDLVQNNLGVDGARLLEQAFTDAAHPLSITSLYLSGSTVPRQSLLARVTIGNRT